MTQDLTAIESRRSQLSQQLVQVEAQQEALEQRRQRIAEQSAELEIQTNQLARQEAELQQRKQKLQVEADKLGQVRQAFLSDHQRLAASRQGLLDELARLEQQAQQARQVQAQAAQAAQPARAAQPAKPAPQARPDPADQRVAPRLSLAVDVSLNTEHNFYMGLTENLSEGGLFIATFDAVPIGTRLELTLNLPGLTPITTQAEVRWQREHSEYTADMAPGIGVRFLSLTEPQQAAIRSFLTQRDPILFEEP